MIVLGLGVAGVAAFATWWFFLRDAGLPADTAVRRPEAIDAAVLRDARYAELRAPAQPQESVRKGRSNPFAPPSVGAETAEQP